MRKLLEDKRRFSTAVFFVILCLVFFRFCYYGFTYYWQADDYIQYYSYTHRGPLPEVIASVGLLSARPLAGLGDVYFWANFSGCMIVAVLLVSAMYAASAVLFWRVFNRKFGTGPVFLVVYTLMPIAFEGTYWLSASTRIVTGLFFASLALYFFCRYVDSGGKRRLIAFMISMVISCGFYEQTLVFAVAAVLLFALLEVGKNRRALWGLFAVAAMGLYFVYISAMPSDSIFSKRTEITLPFRDADYFTDFFPLTVKNIDEAAISASWSTIARGGMRGLRYIIADGAYFYLILAVIFAAALAALFWHRKDKMRKPVAAIVVALLLVIAPVTPFLVLKAGGYGLRCVTASLCGFALLVDTLLAVIFRNRRSVMCVIAAILAVGMSICIVSELHDYRETTLMDNKIASLAAEKLTADGIEERGKKVCIINVKSDYLEEQNYYGKRYIHGCTDSTWALSGMLECYMGYERPLVTPLSVNTWNYNELLDAEYDASYLYTGDELIPVTVSKTDTGWDLFDMNGELAAVIDFAASTLTFVK